MPDLDIDGPIAGHAQGAGRFTRDVAVLGALAIVGAGFNGASFLDYGRAFSSMIMTGLWALALACYLTGGCLVARRQPGQGTTYAGPRRKPRRVPGLAGPAADSMEIVADSPGGLGGTPAGLQIALRNFQENIASRLTDMAVTQYDVLEAGDMLVIRETFEMTHSGEFLGFAPTGRRVCYDRIDMYRVTDGRIVWRYLLSDWKGLRDQLTAAA